MKAWMLTVVLVLGPIASKKQRGVSRAVVYSDRAVYQRKAERQVRLLASLP